MSSQLAEKERLLLMEKKKEEIYVLTCEILDIIHEPQIIELEKIPELKKRITGILSNISIIASCADSKSHNLEPLTPIVNALFSMMNAYGRFVSRKYNKEDEDFAKLISKYSWQKIAEETERFCNIVNSIQFKLTKRGFKIIVPISIRF